MRDEQAAEHEERASLIEEVTFELGELQAATDAVDEAVAERLHINGTDLQCLKLLGRRGAMTAGQLADESGLSPGAITTALDRLERAGHARRTRDEEDRRRVLVELTPAARQSASACYAPVLQAGRTEYERYSVVELRLVRDFLRRARQIQAEHVALLRTTAAQSAPAMGSADEGAGAATGSVPAGVTAGRLEFRRGAARVVLTADSSLRGLYSAHFDGSPPSISVDGGTVSVEYPRRFRAFDWRRAAVYLTLNASLPWSVEVRGGLANIDADLRGLRLTSFSMTGGAANIDVSLPRPLGTVPVHLSGGAASIAFHRPAGVPAGARLTGGAAKLQFDRQQLGAFGGLTRLETPDFADAADRYDFRITGGASAVTIDTR
jgi:DNA-binding MarR family transcriptional regulator